MRAISDNCYQFDEFRLDADERQLWRGDVPIEMTPKALAILQLLVLHAGRTVTKEEILQTVWPDSFVEETNLSHHVFRLRKTLGETEQRKFIETVPKRGYRFIVEVRSAVMKPAEVPVPIEKITSRPYPWSRTLAVVAVVAALAGLTGAYVLYRARTSAKDVQAPASDVAKREPQSIARITNGGKFVAATISPDGKFVAYGQNYTSGEGMLYIRQLESNTERRLLRPADRNFGTLSFSPDGTFVYYISYEPDDPEGALYRIPVIGGAASKVIDDVKFMFSLSPDGKEAAFYRFDNDNAKRRLVVASVAGGGEEKTVLEFPNAGISSVPAYSPDGRFLSFSQADLGLDFTQPQFALSVIELASGTTRRLSEEKWSEIGKTVWKADGSGLTFPGSRPKSGTQLYTMSFPGGEVRQITDELNYYGNYGMGITRDGSMIVADFWETQSQLWSVDANGPAAGGEQLTNGTSDGSTGLASLADGRIAYTTQAGDDTDIWMLRDSDGVREGKPLTADASSEAGICAPRDGRFVVFASDRAGSSHLFRSDLDGSAIHQLTIGEGSEASPECSTDGSFILYSSGGAVWRISADGAGEAVRLTEFECIAPSISPDDKFFACVQPTGLQIKPATLAVMSIDGGAPVKSFEVIPFSFHHRPARWTPDGKGLVFKKTENQIGNLWQQQLTGGPPRKISDFKSDVIFNHAFSSDGKRLIVSRGKFAVNTVVLRNFD